MVRAPASRCNIKRNISVPTGLKTEENKNRHVGENVLPIYVSLGLLLCKQAKINRVFTLSSEKKIKIKYNKCTTNFFFLSKT